MERDYAIVWLGAAKRIEDPRELDQIGDRSHPLIRGALEHNLGYYCDRFDNADADEANYFLLIGINLAALGLKEGRLTFVTEPAELADAQEELSRQLAAVGINDPAQLHVLFHLDNS